jgi:hypothetical protein
MVEASIGNVNHLSNPGTFKNSKFLPENQLQMEHSKLLILPENL